MTRTQYASTITPSAPTVSAIAGNTTSAKAGTYYLFLFCRNRAGVTQFSASATVTIATSQGIRVILPSAIRPTAAVIEYVGVVLSTTNSPGAGCVVATYPGNGALPGQIDLTRDEHLELNKGVSAIADLPSGQDLVHGMRRYVDATSRILAFNNFADPPSWEICKPQIFNPYVPSSLDEGGADRDLADIKNVQDILMIEYATNTELATLSDPITYWIANDTSVNVPQGTRIRMAVATDVFDVLADDFKGLMSLRCAGYVNLVTGELNTATATGSFTYQGDQATNLLLSQPLPPNHAYVLQVRMQASDYLLNNRVMQGDVARIYPRFAPNYAVYNPAGKLTEDFILSRSDRRRILPGGSGLDLIAKDGSGTIKEFNFDQVGEQDVPGLLPDAADQIVVITNTGTCYVADEVPDTGAQRAVVSVIDGLGQISSWSSPITLTSGKALKLTITHPTSIRPDYPDVIAGMSAILNANKIVVFVQPEAGGTIQRFDVAIVGTGTEEITVGGLLTASLGSLPTVPFNQGLFNPVSYTLSAVNASSVFSSGNHKVAIAYLYEKTATVISHDTGLGCVPEFAGTFQDLFAIKQSWGGSVTSSDTATNIRNIPESDTFPWQRRPIYGGEVLYYNPLATDADNGINVFKPVWRNNGQPGRWFTDANTAWYLSTGIPSSGTGATGDFALDAATGEFWYKTNSTTWTLQGTLRGAQGIPGLVFEGAWSATTNYEIGDVVVRRTSSYVAITSNINIDPHTDSGVNWGVLATGIRTRGVWNINDTYRLNDLVTSSGASYLYVNDVPSSGNAVNNATYWQAIASAGPPGDPGVQGPAGSITIGTISTLSSGSNATVTNTGNAQNAVFNFGIPQGTQGPSGTVTANTGVIITASSAPTTGANEVAIFADSGDGNKLKTRQPSNGAIAEIGAGSSSSFDIRDVWLFG